LPPVNNPGKLDRAHVNKCQKSLSKKSVDFLDSDLATFLQFFSPDEKSYVKQTKAH